MKNVDKYSRNYFAPEQTEYQWTTLSMDAAPHWCSVDLRDGNQSLVVRMDWKKEKKPSFLFLCHMGFRYRSCFPAASDTEYQFVRTDQYI